MREINKKTTYLLLFFLIIIFSDGFSFIGYPNYISGFLKYLIGAWCLLLILTRKQVKSTFAPNVVLIFIACPCVSALMSILFRNQTLLQAYLAVFNTLTPVFCYFIFLRLRPNPRDIMTVVLVCSILWTLIEVVQQFSYPMYWFATRNEMGTLNATALERRNGIWRFMIEPWFVGTLSSIYSLCNYFQNKQSKKWLFFSLISLVGVYLYQTRVVLGALVAVLIICYFLETKSRNIMRSVVLAIIVVFLIVENFDFLFGEMLENTANQFDNNENDIRTLGLALWGVEYFPNDLCRIFGNGYPYYSSSYGLEIERFARMGFFRVDVGLVGDYNMYGALYIVVVVLTYCKLFKFRKYIDNYALYAFLAVLVGSFIMPPFSAGSQIFLILTLFYVCDYNINENSKKDKFIVL